MVDLLYIAVVFLVIALIAFVLGARGVAFFTAGIGKFLIWIFLIIFLITIVLRLV